MQHPTRSSLFLCLMVSLLVAVTACGTKPALTPTPAKATEGSTYKIGFIADITGSSSSLGEPERDTAVMVQKQLDAQGGIKGPDGIVHPVKILIYDTEGSGDVGVPVVKKLINDEAVQVIVGPSTSGVSMALVPVVQEAKVPLISMASSSSIVEPVAERQWVFKTAQSNKHTAPLAGPLR